jgi:hypothetical protein
MSLELFLDVATLVLVVASLTLNIVALIVLRRYRRELAAQAPPVMIELGPIGTPTPDPPMGRGELIDLWRRQG